jgi:predicted outer membrane repeat protein
MALLLTVAPLRAATYYVDVNYDNSQGTDTGAPDRPYTSITLAVAAANTNAGNVVLVADGLYQSIGNGGYESFSANGIVATNSMTVKGGYVGQVAGATFDWSDSNRSARASVIDLSGTAARAFYLNLAGKSLTVDGFTIRNGNVVGDGGAVYISGGFNGFGAVLNCLFSNNVATGNGGAVYLSGNNVAGGTVSNCTFAANQGGQGGGLNNALNNPSITAWDCVFQDNIATNTGNGGGGLATSGMALRRCTFLRNLASGATGRGGAVCVNANSGVLNVYQCVFTANQAGNTGTGSGSVAAGGTFNPGTFYAENCLLTANTGAFTVVESGNSSAANVTLKHCTLADNVGGAVRADLSSGAVRGDVTIQNCIFANNGSVGVTTDDPTIDYNDFFGQTTNYAGTALAGVHDLSGRSWLCRGRQLCPCSRQPVHRRWRELRRRGRSCWHAASDALRLRPGLLRGDGSAGRGARQSRPRRERCLARGPHRLRRPNQ